MTAADPLCDALIVAGAAVGMVRVDDLNETDVERIGFTMATISNGGRVSAAHAFTPSDRRAGLAIFARMMEMFASDALAPHIDHETGPGAPVQDDRAIIDMALDQGSCGYHAVGTCAMGPDETNVVDSQPRVRGVEGLRVTDCSVMPVMVAGNLNGPMMAMAWRAADVIRDGL